MKKHLFRVLVLALLVLFPIQNSFAAYCFYSGNKNAADRNLNSFTLTDGSNSVNVTSIQTTSGPVYVDKTSFVLNTTPGATLRFSALDWPGYWMHAYVFIDYNNDESFNNTLNADGTTGGELVSYNFYSSTGGATGTNSIGESVGEGCHVTKDNIPAWTLPSDLATGTYRLRFNIAWNSIEPCGYNEMASNSGAMVDIVLNVVNPTAERTITVSSSNSEWGTVSGGGTASGQITITATPNAGYVFKNWTVGGVEVSTSATYVDDTEGDKTYLATFILDPTLDRSAWTIFDKSSEYDGVDGDDYVYATKAIDGNPNTYWHTDWNSAANQTVPQWIVFNLGSVQTFDSFNYLSRRAEAAANGNIDGYKLYISTEAPTIGSLTTTMQEVASGTFTYPGQEHKIQLDQPYSAQYVMLYATSTYGVNTAQNNLFANCAEFYLYLESTVYTVTVTPSDAAMGTVTPTNALVAEGQNITITATPNEGYEFVKWTVDGGDGPNTNPWTVPVTEDLDFVANFQIIPGSTTYNITVASADETMGTASASTLEVIEGNTVTLTATANEGYRFVNWTVNDEEVSTENPYAATISAETAFVANFEEIPTFTVNVSTNDATMGTVSPETLKVEVGNTVTLTATANEGAEFVNWTVNDEEVSTNPTYTFAVSADVDVKANFIHAYCKPSVATQGTDASYVGQIVTLTTTGAAVDANWTNPKTENFNGSTSVIENTFTAEAGQTVTLNIADKNTTWGWVRVYVDLNGNYIFDDGEQIFADTNRGRTQPISQQFTIANTVEAGTYLMRIFYVGGNDTSKGVCDSYSEGGYFDFEFNVTAPFVIEERTITVKANNDAWGTVEGGATSTGRVTISATANEGYQFVNWTIEGDDTFSSTSTTYVDETAGSKTYIANFEMLPADEYTLALIEAAKELLGQDGVGFPSNSERTLLQSAVATAEANPYAGAATALQTAINAYISTANIKIPEAGKAYAFVLAVSETSLYYINNSDGTLTAVSYDGTSTLPETAKFITSIVDGNKYAFQSVVDNKYMAIPSNEDWMTEESQSATGLDESVSVVSKFDVSKLVAGMNSFVTAEADQLLGMVYLSASRGIKTETSEPEAGVIIITSGGAFDKSGSPYCNGNFTSAIRMVEVDYTPTYAVSVSADATMGTAEASATEVEENETVTLTATANEGYEFVNWTVEGTAVSTENPYTATITAETSFVANFQAKEYTITYYVDGEEYATETYDFGADVTAQAEPTKEGYTFSGWSEVPATMPANNVEVTGTFAINSYTITYYVDGSVYTTETYDFGATVTPVAAPVKAGYSFSGWSTIPATMPANNVEVTGTFTITPNLDVTTDNKEESADATYSTVTVANEKVWDVKENAIAADKVSVKVETNGAAPEVKIADGGQITTVLEISRVVEKGKWALMSLPFAVDLANVTVDGAPAANNSNIKVMVYDAAYRAANSVEDWTKSGWVDLVGTTIAANQGFAVAINANNGDEQTVTFTATAQTYDGADKQIALSRYASTVNGGADADWNFYGNPTLAKAQKGTGYALYVYNAEDDSYEEYASSDVATYLPYAAWFVQSADDFNAMSFSAGVAGALAEANGVYGELQFSLNGEDEARVVLVDDASEEYVRNEDALYFPAMNANLSQLYLVKGNMKMAVSEQPALTTMAMGYKAVKAGEQTLTLTSIPENASVVLVDNVAGTETAMTLGDTYTFQSEAGTFNNRFVIETTDLTGIAQAVADGEVKVIVSGDDIKVYGAEAGTEVVAYTTNGTVVASAVATDGVTTLSTTASGVIVVKVANTAVKVLK